MWKSLIISYRSLHTSSTNFNKIGRVMNKVLRGTSKRKKYSEQGILPTTATLSQGSNEGRFSGSARRVSVLNKLFMKHITDLLMTGQYSSEFAGLNIEINRVKVTPDYNGINVFWVAKGNQTDEVVEDVLKKNAAFLRHELSSLRVVGNVPRITFVKDKHYSQIMEVDVRLAKADFGEDYVPLEISRKLKSELELISSLPADIKEKIQEIDREDNTVEDLLPPMSQNVLGLNHSDILCRIKRGMKKSQGLMRSSSIGMETEQCVNENQIQFASNKERRETFREFLEKRELERSKSKKNERFFPNVDMLDHDEDFFDDDSHDFEDFGDYVEEVGEVFDEFKCK